jgi:DNA-directed RNA polymerase specialized sigma24 family protein
MLFKILGPGNYRLNERQEKIIRAKVAMLPQQERIAIFSVFWQELPYFQVARSLDVPVVEVDKIIQNALIRLRSNLDEIADGYFGTQTPENELNKAA